MREEAERELAREIMIRRAARGDGEGIAGRPGPDRRAVGMGDVAEVLVDLRFRGSRKMVAEGKISGGGQTWRKQGGSQAGDGCGGTSKTKVRATIGQGAAGWA